VRLIIDEEAAVRLKIPSNRAAYAGVRLKF
jgi:hypothetical protein